MDTRKAQRAEICGCMKDSLWKFCKGYVIIQIDGLSAERFLTRCTANGIALLNVDRPAPRSLRCAMDAKSFLRLPAVHRRCPCRIHIVERRGLPFVWRRAKRRPVLLFGAPLFFALLLFLSTRLWFFRFDGLKTLTEAELAALLQQQGVTTGCAYKGLDLVALAHRITIAEPRLEWLGLTRRGVILEIECTEADPTDKKPDLSEPCDVVAAKAGVITRITTLRGKAAVSVGQRVEAGELLIGGHVVYKEDMTSYTTHAQGEVYAAISYGAWVAAPQTLVELTRTGEWTRYIRIEAAGHTLMESAAPYAHSEQGELQTAIFNKPLLPVTVTTGRVYELVETERTAEQAEREALALALAEEEALAQLPKDAAILLKTCFLQEKDGVLYGVCCITTEERIDLTRELEHDG